MGSSGGKRSLGWLIGITVALVIVAVSVVAVLWRVGFRAAHGLEPYSRRRPVEALNWAATLPDVGEVKLVEVVDPKARKPCWWAPGGDVAARAFPTDAAEADIGVLLGSGSTKCIRSFRLNLAKGLPKDFEMKAQLGSEQSGLTSCIYDQDGPPGQSVRSACITFGRNRFPASDDLYVGIAAGKPSLLAMQTWPSGKVKTVGTQSEVTISAISSGGGASRVQLMIDTDPELNDNRLTILAKDATGKRLDCLSSGSTNHTSYVRVGAYMAGTDKRTVCYVMKNPDYRRLASVEVYRTPFRWIVFRNVQLQPR